MKESLALKLAQIIDPHDWPSRRPDGQTANAESDPVPSVKGSGRRPGLERIEVRVPTQTARKFKLRCTLLQLKQYEVIAELIDAWLAADVGRLDGQTAIDRIDDPMIEIDDEVNKFLTSSSDLIGGRPDGQLAGDPKRCESHAYYVSLTGNRI